MKDKIKTIIGMVVAVILIVLIGIIISNGTKAEAAGRNHPVATFEIADYGTVKMELYPEYAPNTVSNFIALIEAGYYQQKIINGKDDVCLYMGRPADTESEEEEESSKDEGPTVSLIDASVEADSDEDYEYEIDGEFVANGFEQNTLRHEKGVISFNRYDYSTYGLKEESYNSGSAQFSVMMKDEPDLDGLYCVFGRVIEGLDVLEKIYNEAEIEPEETTEEEETVTETEIEGEEVTEETEEEDEKKNTIQEFVNKPVITNAIIEKNGVDYGTPDVHEKFDIQSYINDLYSSYYSN